MRKAAITYIAIVIAMAIIMIIGIKYILNTISEEEDKFAMPVGEQVIISKDTLTIVDYSIFDSTYKLSDDSTISHIYYKKLKAKGHVLQNDN